MENNRNKTNINVGFLGYLGIAFIILKLVGVINWRWIWVLAPIWGEFAIVGVLLLAIAVLRLVEKFYIKRSRKKYRKALINELKDTTKDNDNEEDVGENYWARRVKEIKEEMSQ